MIPQADPKRRFDAVREEIMRAIAGVFDRGRFMLGPETEAFEAEFAAAAAAPPAGHSRDTRRRGRYVRRYAACPR